MTLRSTRKYLTVLIGVAAGLLGPAGASAAIKLVKVAPAGGGSTPEVGVVRTSDGVLHLAYPAKPGKPGGLGMRRISAAGIVGPQVLAAVGWNMSDPGLLAMANGTLWSAFGAVPNPPKPSGIWGVSSSNHGASWTAPSVVGAGGSVEALSYGASITGQLVGSSPMLTLNVAGALIIQKGLGAGSTAFQVNTPSNYDGFVGNVTSAVDPAAGELVAGWQSIATPGGDFIQGVAPKTMKAQKVPGQMRTQAVVAGRDKGPGVFIAYTPDNTHVRLLRYGGGSVAVGSVKGLTAAVMGVATGKDGRIWVMWGDDSKRQVAVTRSNKSVTAFGRVQLINTNAFDLWQFFGDGRLGPLDLFVDEAPNAKQIVSGIYYARVLPALAAKVAVKPNKKKKGKVVSFKLTVKVNDAGAAVAGAKVSAKGKTATTNSLGTATLVVSGKSGSKVTVTATRAGYAAAQVRVKL